MPAQRTGGRVVKIHKLDGSNRHWTLCQRVSSDVAFTLNESWVTCKRCERAFILRAGRPLSRSMATS